MDVLYPPTKKVTAPLPLLHHQAKEVPFGSRGFLVGKSPLGTANH